jgi:indoleamine 2,3-dioxygenase
MRGFLPDQNPHREYGNGASASLDRLQDIANQLPKLLLTGRVPTTIRSLHKDDLAIEELLSNDSNQDLQLAMVHFSFIAHALVLGGPKPVSLIPEVIARPWVQLSKKLGRPPVLSYASYCLNNWFLLDNKETISLENVGLITNFLGGVDEDWFVTVHVCIENAAADAIEAATALATCSQSSDENDVTSLLDRITQSMIQVNRIFARMPERCDPYIYYHRVRPFIFGSKDNPDLKQGLIFENQFSNNPQFFRGETGAQSSIIPSLDGALGIKHKSDSLRHYLNEMRNYMPTGHRNFIESIERKSQLRNLVDQSSRMKNNYNNCLEQLSIFRSRHLNYADAYINQQAQMSNPMGQGGSTIIGTGGTPFMAYLRKHRDETKEQKK